MLIENRANIYQFDEYGGNVDFSIHVLTDELESEERLLQRFDTCLNIYKNMEGVIELLLEKQFTNESTR